MDVITVFSGPRHNGNTATVLKWTEEALIGSGHEVERINMRDTEVKPCLGCYACQAKPGVAGCVQKDAGNELFERMAAADATIFASPLYCWDVAAQLKPVIDRAFCTATGYGGAEHESILEGSRFGLLITCGGPIEGNCDAVRMILKGWCEFTKVTPAAELIVPGATTPDNLGDGVRAQAEAFAKALTGE